VAACTARKVCRRQATNGAGWMSRHQVAMKDVEDCDKPGGAVKQAQIPGSPNGITRLCASGGIRSRTSALVRNLSCEGERGEVKHLSTLRKRKQPRLP
jgi:hypothetical protein